jgi:ankyrin repeat protein
VAVALLDAGANIDFATPPRAFTPLIIATNRNYASVVKLLLKRGANGMGLHSFPFQLNLSSSVHRITQLNS